MSLQIRIYLIHVCTKEALSIVSLKKGDNFAKIKSDFGNEIINETEHKF